MKQNRLRFGNYHYIWMWCTNSFAVSKWVFYSPINLYVQRLTHCGVMTPNGDLYYSHQPVGWRHHSIARIVVIWNFLNTFWLNEVRNTEYLVKKMHLKMASAKGLPFLSGISLLTFTNIATTAVQQRGHFVTIVGIACIQRFRFRLIENILFSGIMMYQLANRI